MSSYSYMDILKEGLNHPGFAVKNVSIAYDFQNQNPQPTNSVLFEGNSRPVSSKIIKKYSSSSINSLTKLNNIAYLRNSKKLCKPNSTILEESDNINNKIFARLHLINNPETDIILVKLDGIFDT